MLENIAFSLHSGIQELKRILNIEYDGEDQGKISELAKQRVEALRKKMFTKK